MERGSGMKRKSAGNDKKEPISAPAFVATVRNGTSGGAQLPDLNGTKVSRFAGVVRRIRTLLIPLSANDRSRRTASVLPSPLPLRFHDQSRNLSLLLPLHRVKKLCKIPQYFDKSLKMLS